LSGAPQPLHRQLLALYLERYQLIQGQIREAASDDGHGDAGQVTISPLPAQA
jgi:hypothetical protein